MKNTATIVYNVGNSRVGVGKFTKNVRLLNVFNSIRHTKSDLFLYTRNL